MTTPLTLAHLTQAVATGAAIRLRRRLQPAGGPGDKVFPPTYEGGTYAVEPRVIEGKETTCILLDSVQSQANRMELALLAAHRNGRISIPVIGVDFGADDLGEIGWVTSLDAPHRIADAILRDSMVDGKKFREHPAGKCLETATPAKAGDLFGWCPTALVFGLWDSTGPRGGLGTKFQRALVSEIVAVGASIDNRKPASRIDPLNISAVLYETESGEWTVDKTEAKTEKGKPVLYKKDGKPSVINHGNVTPALDHDDKKSKKRVPNHGGTTMQYALQSTVMSLPAIRRLSFTANAADSNLTGQTALAALGLCAAALSVDLGCDLRSRCLLVPEGAATWELIQADGTATPWALSGADAEQLLGEAVSAAKAKGLPWLAKDKAHALDLRPSPGLAALVKKSRELSVSTTSDSDEG